MRRGAFLCLLLALYACCTRCVLAVEDTWTPVALYYALLYCAELGDVHHRSRPSWPQTMPRHLVPHEKYGAAPHTPCVVHGVAVVRSPLCVEGQLSSNAFAGAAGARRSAARRGVHGPTGRCVARQRLRLVPAARACFELND